MNTIKEKIILLQDKLAPLSAENRYLALIELGRSLPTYPKELKIPLYEVRGCQSILYLYTQKVDGLLFFQADSEALISKGLAALLIAVYNNESPRTILETSPSFLADFGILGTLSPSRSNGLAQIHKKMKEEALYC